MAERFANYRGGHVHGLGHHAGSHAARGMSRRQFVTMAMAGAGIAGAGVIGLSGQAAAKAGPARGIPKQLPSFSPILQSIFGIEVPFILPFEIDPFINPGPLGDPTTFDDFTGTMGMVEAEGVSDNNSEGVPRTWAVDARFWEGRYIDRGGHVRNGAFAFL